MSRDELSLVADHLGHSLDIHTDPVCGKKVVAFKRVLAIYCELRECIEKQNTYSQSGHLFL